MELIAGKQYDLSDGYFGEVDDEGEESAPELEGVWYLGRTDTSGDKCTSHFAHLLTNRERGGVREIRTTTWSYSLDQIDRYIREHE